MINLSTGAFYESATRQLSSLRAQANDLQTQVTSQQRLSRSSDDPVTAARLRTLNRSERLSQIDTVNSDRAMTDLQLTDSALQSMADVLARVRELATYAASDTVSADQRATLGQEVSDLRESLLLIANSRNSSGHSLFGGESAGSAYESVGGVVSYIGSASTKPVELGEDQQVIPGLTGPEVLSFDLNGTPTDLFAVLGSLSAALQGGVADPASAANDALGALDASLSKLTTAQTIVGTRMNWIEMMDQRRETTGELRSQEAETIGGADTATTIVKLQEVMTVLEASQASFVQLSGLSLFNLIR